MFNKYYEDEIAFLREMGKEFSRANPKAAGFLGERGADPDVERLFEGFAFLVGRLRQKLDDELPELTQSLMQMLWPHYLRPVPAMSILQFRCRPGMVQEDQSIPRGTEVESVPVGGTPCQFRTSYEVRLLPLDMTDASLERPAGESGRIRLEFVLQEGVKPEGVDPNPLRLFLHGEPSTTSALFLSLTRWTRRITVRSLGKGGGGNEVKLPLKALRAVGFRDDEALLPYPRHSFPGYRLIQEFFALPQKFHFIELQGLPSLSDLGAEMGFEIIFDLSRPAEIAGRIGPENFRLHCTPVINLFPAESDPIRVDHRKVEYWLRPGGGSPEHFLIFSIEKVKGWIRGTSEEREYPPFFSFRHSLDNGSEDRIIFYSPRLRGSILDRGLDTYLSFVTGGQESVLPPTETVVADLVCTNRFLPAKLGIGDLNRPGGSSPQFATFENIIPVTPTVIPPIEGDLHWRLISNMSLNFLSLGEIQTFRDLLGVYNLRALTDRQAARESELRLAGLLKLGISPEERLYRGLPIRGTRIELEIREENFNGEGEMVLFGNVLNRFLGLACTVNSFTRLVVRGADHGDVYEWDPRVGQQTLI